MESKELTDYHPETEKYTFDIPKEPISITIITVFKDNNLPGLNVQTQNILSRDLDKLREKEGESVEEVRS